MKEENKDTIELNEEEIRYIDDESTKGYYEKLRENIKKKLYKVERRFGKNGVEIVLLAPDLFVHLTRLMRDARVDTRKKIILGAVIAYWILPTDILPEILTGAIGYLDDILITLYVLDSLFADTDMEVLLDNWPGDPEVIKNIHLYAQKVKKILATFGGNLEQKAVRFAELMLQSRKNGQ